MQKGGEIITDILGENLKTSDTETSFELNLNIPLKENKISS